MSKITEWPAQWKIAAGIVAVLIVIGFGVALQRGASGGGVSIADMFGIKSEPSLTGSVKYTTDMSDEARQQLEGLIAELRAQLKEEYNYDAWLSLAIRYKQAGDFSKARDVWEYLASIHPDDSTVRHNLADLFHHFEVDYAKAEKYYKEAIELAPMSSRDYLALHELYRYSYKQDTGAAVEIVEQGIANTADNQSVDLYIALANYYTDKDDFANARKSFEEARSLAQAAGNAKLVSQLDAALAMLGQ